MEVLGLEIGLEYGIAYSLMLVKSKDQVTGRRCAGLEHPARGAMHTDIPGGPGTCQCSNRGTSRADPRLRFSSIDDVLTSGSAVPLSLTAVIGEQEPRGWRAPAKYNSFRSLFSFGCELLPPKAHDNKHLRSDQTRFVARVRGRMLLKGSI